MTYEEWYVKNNIIHESKYKDFKIIIVRMKIPNIRIWECAYVIFPENCKYLLEYDFIYDNDDLYTVHGGFTFQEEFGIGWDYAHLDDIDRHYTINEMRNEAYSVIDQLEGRKKMNYQESEELLAQKLKCEAQLENIKDEYEVLYKTYKDLERRYRKYCFTEETLILQNKCPCCDKDINCVITNDEKVLYPSFGIKLYPRTEYKTKEK